MRSRLVLLTVALAAMLLAANYAVSPVGDEEAREALALAAHSGNGHEVVGLLRNGASPDTRDPGVFGNSPVIILAAEQGRTHVVDLLLSLGASVDARDERGNTALILAARNGHLSTVEVLLKRGASPHARNVLGIRAVDAAVNQANLEIVASLRRAARSQKQPR